MRFAGKCVVVLGGNAGIGLAAPRLFRAEGVKLALMRVGGLLELGS